MKTSEKQKQNARNQYRRRVAAGICIHCRNPAEKPHIRCAVCKEITADYCAGRRDIWKLKGLCANCGKNPPRAGRVTCQTCADKSKGNRKNAVREVGAS